MEDQLSPTADAWMDDRLVVSDSPIEGRGLFFSSDISAGTIVIRLGGRLVSSTELAALVHRAQTDPAAQYVDTITIFDDAHLVLPADSSIHYGNHSCDPTLWVVGPFEVATRRHVTAGEEATVDYATMSGAVGLRMECRCGVPACRGEVTNTDWMRHELQERYRGHWVPALQQRIAAMEVPATERRVAGGVDGVRVRSATGFVPDALAALAEEADAEGIRVVRAVIDRWQSGAERYERSGEQLLVAVTDEGVVGLGGLTICPTVPGALRVRRFYVHPAWRRRGVAAAITSALLASWPPDVSEITCNARASAAAPRFWEAMGFEPVDDESITHVLRRPTPDRAGSRDLA